MRMFLARNVCYHCGVTREQTELCKAVGTQPTYLPGILLPKSNLQMNKCMDMNRRTNRWTDEQMDGQTDGRTNGQTDERKSI